MIESLRSSAAAVAHSSAVLAEQVAAEKFSLECEFSIAYSQSLSGILSVPRTAQEPGAPLLSLGQLQQNLSRRSPQPCMVPPASDGKRKRPLWTVAIPVCDPNPNYFPGLLDRVVKALAKTASSEIVIIDVSAKKDALASLAGVISKHRIQVVTLATGSGIIAAKNEGLRRARGEFVQLLEQDDFVFEKFYHELGSALKAQPEAGFAACCNEFIDARGRVVSAGYAEEKSGLYRDVNFAAVWAYRLPFSGIVVRRALYEALGGFHEDLGLWAEWEMRARLFAASPLWYHHEVMVLPRLHSASRRQGEMRAAKGLDACPQAIAMAVNCYPVSIASDFGRVSTELFARELAHFGCCLFTAGRVREGLLHFEAAQGLCSHPNILDIMKRRSFHLLKSQAETKTTVQTNLQNQESPPPAVAAPNADFFPADELQNLQSVVTAYRADPADTGAYGQIRALRNGLCAYLLDADAASLEGLFSGNFTKVFLMVRESGVSAEAEGDEEKLLAMRVAEIFSTSPGDSRALLATMLLSPAHSAAMPVEFVAKPDWLMGLYMDYLLASPDGFVQPREADKYWEHLAAILKAACAEIAQGKMAVGVKNALFQTALRLNLIPAYFSERDMKEIMRMRAQVIRFLLEQNGHCLEATFSPRPFQRKKIRVGFLSAHLGPQTETYTSAPSFYLDREKFEIHLFVLANNPSAIETHCRSVVDTFTVLPPLLAARIETVRGAGLDVLVIGTNMTAVSNEVTLLGACRLAPIQIASSSSPMTPGLPHLDGFMSGLVHGYDAYSGQYNERLLLFDGALSCLEYSVDRPKAKTAFNRQDFGIPAGAPLFVSGANFFKILPELQATWVKILQQVPGSYLLLHPFNPNWTNRYPVARFRRDIRRAFEQAGLDPARIVISEKTLPTRADVSQLMSLGDVYLDSFPFSGSVSLVDPLEAGVPPVAWRAAATRGLMAASMLSDLDLRELVAESEEMYVATAVRLATEPKERDRISAKICTAMAAGPRFFDVQKYGQEVTRVLEEIVLAERKVELAPASGEILRRAETALNAGRLGDVEDLCRYLLEREPTTAAAWALLAELARRCGDLDYATDLAVQAVELDPNSADFWSALGEIRREKQEPEGALDAFCRAIELRPASPAAWLGKAAVHDSRKEAAEAEQAYKQAVNHSKDRSETIRAREGFAHFLKGQKRLKEAIQQLRQAASAAPDSCEILLGLGSFLMADGELAEAEAMFARVVKKSPDSGRNWLEWGKALLLLGKSGEAVEKMRRAVACQPNDSDALFNLGYALQQNARSSEALQAYRDAARAGCDTPALHANVETILKAQPRTSSGA